MADLVITKKENLVSIADAIREKADISDEFTFPNGFVDAISGISTGSKIVTGSITPTSNGEFQITHGLGVVPKWVMVWDSAQFSYNYTYTNYQIIEFVIKANEHSNLVFYAGGSGKITYKAVGASDCNITLDSAKNSALIGIFAPAHKANSTTITIGNKNEGYILVSGRTYNWMIAG